MKKSKKVKKSAAVGAESRIDKLLDSLEIVSARMLEMIVTSSQLASAQTPEMQALFQKWVGLMADELLSAARDGDPIDLAALSQKIGISRSTVAALLLYLDRKGDLQITEMRAVKGDGKNRDICGCVA